VWAAADVTMGCMALINLPVIVYLSRPAMAALKDYTAQLKAGKDPEFEAASIGLEGKTEFWN
jgi:AGCS family alanine or glycine:cation symporter